MRLLSTFAVAALVGGCVVQGPNENQSGQDIEVSNWLSVFRLFGNHLNANTLANAQITASTGQVANGMALSPSADALLATTDGRIVLTYIVSCALPLGTVLTANDGTTFIGEMGIAASWVDHALNEDQQRWLSACLFSRVNGLGVAVEISLRGPHPELKTSSSEIASFTKQEGAFYGQYFNVDTVQAFACSGSDNAAALADDRECATPAGNGLTKCGFTYTGTCNESNTGAACQNFAGAGYFVNCTNDASNPTMTTGGGHGNSDSFTQVMTAYVQ